MVTPSEATMEFIAIEDLKFDPQNPSSLSAML